MTDANSCMRLSGRGVKENEKASQGKLISGYNIRSILLLALTQLSYVKLLPLDVAKLFKS